MIRRNKNKREIFHSKNTSYTMSDNYKTSDLIVGNLEYISNNYNHDGTMAERTSQKYIFEMIIENGKTKYREVFTGYIANTENSYFNIPYIVNIKPLKEEIPSIANKIHKYGLLLIINEINIQKKVKTLKKWYFYFCLLIYNKIKWN